MTDQESSARTIEFSIASNDLLFGTSRRIPSVMTIPPQKETLRKKPSGISAIPAFKPKPSVNDDDVDEKTRKETITAMHRKEFLASLETKLQAKPKRPGTRRISKQLDDVDEHTGRKMPRESVVDADLTIQEEGHDNQDTSSTSSASKTIISNQAVKSQTQNVKPSSPDHHRAPSARFDKPMENYNAPLVSDHQKQRIQLARKTRPPGRQGRPRRRQGASRASEGDILASTTTLSVSQSDKTTRSKSVESILDGEVSKPYKSKGILKHTKRAELEVQEQRDYLISISNSNSPAHSPVRMSKDLRSASLTDILTEVDKQEFARKTSCQSPSYAFTRRETKHYDSKRHGKHAKEVKGTHEQETSTDYKSLSVAGSSQVDSPVNINSNLNLEQGVSKQSNPSSSASTITISSNSPSNSQPAKFQGLGTRLPIVDHGEINSVKLRNSNGLRETTAQDNGTANSNADSKGPELTTTKPWGKTTNVVAGLKPLEPKQEPVKQVVSSQLTTTLSAVKTSTPDDVGIEQSKIKSSITQTTHEPASKTPISTNSSGSSQDDTLTTVPAWKRDLIARKEEEHAKIEVKKSMPTPFGKPKSGAPPAKFGQNKPKFSIQAMRTPHNSSSIKDNAQDDSGMAPWQRELKKKHFND